MPTEIRQITFRAQEVILAITEYYRRRNLPLPLGSAVGVTFDGDTQISAVMSIQTAQGDMTPVPVTSEVLAAALILFCINRKIPLPAESEKRLQKVGADLLALVVIRRQR